MAEIKSTLDLVLERTKHLTLSNEEKQHQKLEEFKERLNGLIQKALDAVITLDQFADELQKLQHSTGILDLQVVCEALTDRLSLEATSPALLSLLQRTCSMETAQLESVLLEYRQTLQTKAEEHKKRLEDAWATRGINGSALVPHLDVDSVWTAEETSLRTAYLERLRKVVHHSILHA